MSFQSIVLKIYASVLRRIHSWVLPMIILLLYFSAYGVNDVQILTYVPRIVILTLHIYSGFFLIFILIIFGYDVISRFFMENEEINMIEEERYQVMNGKDRVTYRGMVDWIFYFTLIFTCCLGVILFYISAGSWKKLLPVQSHISIIHVLLGWSFLLIVIIKYYLALIKWMDELKRYLRD